MSPVLRAEGLTVTVGPSGARLVGPLDLTVAAGERVGLVGASGAGKSLAAATALGTLPPGLTAQGAVRLDAGAGGRAAGALFQESSSALDALVPVGAQIGYPLTDVSRRERRAAVAALSGRLGLDPAALDARPLALSGGQRQRAALALALARSPRLLVADEPTSALDAATQQAVLATMDEALAADGTALLLISHDLALVAALCDRVVVLDDGLVAEEGPVAQVLTAPRHPVTRRLVDAARTLGVTA